MNTTPVVLVEMPFSSYAKPVYSLSLLKACLAARGIGSTVLYGNMLFSRYSGIDEYLTVLYAMGQRLLLPEAVFLEQAGLKDAGALAAYCEELRRAEIAFSPARKASFIALIERLQSAAARFLDDLTAQVLALGPRVVGLSSMFFQNNACFALARRIKQAAPSTVVVVGGPNAMGEAGRALVKRVPWVDFAFSGEADECFAELCALLLAHGSAVADAQLPYGTISKTMEGGEAPVRCTRDLDAVPVPDYGDYFAALRACGLEDEVHPALFTEFSRGCWWHDRAGCRFCGLNGKNNRYRIKSSDKILADLTQLRQTYGIGCFSLTDNVLSPTHIRQLAPRLARLPEKYAFFAEVKSNLSARQLRLLRRAGFCVLQPGIESLHDGFLRCFRKGNRAIKHIELLRDLDANGIYTVWQLLGGAPGERAQWYEELAALFPAISHLMPPQQLAHIVFNRYSAYAEAPEAYGLRLRPLRWYRFVYPDETEFIAQTAQMFEPEDEAERAVYYDIRQKGAVCEAVQQSIVEWLRQFRAQRDRLEVTRASQYLEILDLRRAADRASYRLEDARRLVYEACERSIAKTALRRKLAGAVEPRALEEALEFLLRRRLVLEIGGELLALGVPNTRLPYARLEDGRTPFGSYRRMLR